MYKIAFPAAMSSFIYFINTFTGSRSLHSSTFENKKKCRRICERLKHQHWNLVASFFITQVHKMTVTFQEIWIGHSCQVVDACEILKGIVSTYKTAISNLQQTPVKWS